jgi:SAM domain (Sterile alpha motif)
MRDIAEWLASIGLDEYAQRFAENRIDASVLRDLTDQDLEKIGIPLGHRKKMLRAIAEIGGAVLTPGHKIYPYLLRPVIDPGSLARLAADLKTVWAAPSTDARLKKRIVRTLIHEVIPDIDPEGRYARW